jgi:peptide/nickel transport system substrate-binding protein
MRATLMTSTIAAAFAAAAVWAPAMAQTLEIGLIEDVDTLDPAQGRTLGGRQVFSTLCDKLFEVDSDGNLQPELALEHVTSEDGLTVTLTLRQGVVFHDGEPFNAQAVKYNLDRAMTMEESARKGDLRAIERVEVIDDYTVALILHQPYTPLLAQLADRPGMMISPAAAEAKGPDGFATDPVCSGPFRLVEQIPQDHIELARFEDYWNADNIHIERVIYRPVPDATVRLNNLLAGQLDLIEQVATTDLEKLRSTEGFEVASVTGLGHFHLLFNLAGDGPFAKSAALRQAVDAAIDRNIINQAVFGGEFVPGNQPVQPASPYYAGDFPVPARDLERAKALVAESGVDSPSLAIVLNNNPTFLRVAQVIQSMLAEAGITVTLNPTDSGTATGLVTSGDFEGFFSFWSGRVDPDANTHTYLGCTGSQNSGGYCNEEVEALLTRAAAASDPAVRADLYAQAAAIWMADAPTLFIYHPKLFFGYSSAVQGFTPFPDGLVRLDGVTLAED